MNSSTVFNVSINETDTTPLNSLLSSFIEIERGKKLEKSLKQYKNGFIKVLRNGKKIYNLDIKTNEGEFLKGDLIIINNISLDIRFIREDERKNYFFGLGCFVIGAYDYKFNDLISILFNVLDNEAPKKSLKKLHKGSLQPFITDKDILKVINLYLNKPFNPNAINIIEDLEELRSEEKTLKIKLEVLEIKKKLTFKTLINRYF